MSVQAYRRPYFPIREGKESKSSDKLATAKRTQEGISPLRLVDELSRMRCYLSNDIFDAHRDDGSVTLCARMRS